MKQSVAPDVIEFPSKLIMANTSNILAIFAIAFLVSLSSSSAFAKNDLDIPSAFEKRFDHELQPFLREKRQKKAEVFHLGNNNPLELEEELSEPKSIYDRRAVGEEVKEIGQKEDGKNEEQEKPSTEPKTSNTEEEGEDAQSDVFSYRSMHDLIQALILADEEDIAERLQQLRENATKSEALSNLPKRQAVASASAAAAAAASASSDLLGANLWDNVPLVDLDAHSCEVEAFSHGHFHMAGTIVHEFFCELRKLWHYGLIVLRNFKSELTLGPLIAGDVVADGIFGHLFHHASHFVHAVIREPHHLLILPDIIRDAIPHPSITGAFQRLKHVFFKVLHFVLDLFHEHVRHVIHHFLSHHHLGVRLLENLHYLHQRRCGSILPLEGIIGEPIVSTATSASATATATATATASSVVPDYHQSLAEVLSSFRGFYNGYYASGVPHLIRTGAKSFSMFPVVSRISSYLPRIPFLGCFGYGPSIEQDTTVTASSASNALSSVDIGGSIVGPVISPVTEPTIVPLASIVPIKSETASSSASATATATATATVADTQPAISAGPIIVPSAIPYESSYPIASLIQPVPTLSPAVVSNTVSESSSVAVATPEVVATMPAVLEGNAAAASAAASVSAATSSDANVVVEQVPLTLPSRRYRFRSGPILSIITPAAATAAAAAAASASASTVGQSTLLEPTRYRGLDLDIDRGIRYPLIRPRVFPAVAAVPSSAAASSSAAAAAAASASGAAASSSASGSASSVSPGGINIVLPRQQIVGALGYDYLLPGDVIAVTLRNKSTLFGRVLDATSPITFGFPGPKLRTSFLRHGGRVWNLQPRHFKDPECVRKFNNPLLLRYGL